MPIPFVPNILSPRFWIAVAWLILSALFVQPARAAYVQMPPFFMETGGARDPVRYLARSPRFTGYFETGRVTLMAGRSTLRLRFQ